MGRFRLVTNEDLKRTFTLNITERYIFIAYYITTYRRFCMQINISYTIIVEVLRFIVDLLIQVVSCFFCNKLEVPHRT